MYIKHPKAKTEGKNITHFSLRTLYLPLNRGGKKHNNNHSPASYPLRRYILTKASNNEMIPSLTKRHCFFFLRYLKGIPSGENKYF